MYKTIKQKLFTFSFRLPLIDIQNSFAKSCLSSQSSTSSTWYKGKAVTLYNFKRNSLSVPQFNIIYIGNAHC